MGSGSLRASGDSGSNDSLNSLKFGKKIYFEDVGSSGGVGVSSSKASAASASSESAAKKGRGVVQGRPPPPPPRCQVEGCEVDLTGAKPYYCRHKVCGMHSKSPKVIVAGLEQRFCQQCSRFHQLPEFDQGKRSCRRRLAGHNERRRKPPLSSRHGQLPSTFHDSGRFGGFLMDFSYPRVPGTARDVWPTVRVGDPGTGSQVAHSHLQCSAGETLFLCREIPPGKGLGVSDSSCALSLLSTQSWGTTATIGSRAPTISVNGNYEVVSMSPPAIATSFAGNLWTGTDSHEIPREIGLGQAVEPPGGGHFSGELELALQGNRQCMGLEHGRACGPSGQLMHWSL